MVASLDLLLGIVAAAAAAVVPLGAQASVVSSSQPLDGAALQRRADSDWRLRKRATTTDAAQLAGQTFDYVIVGCVLLSLSLLRRCRCEERVVEASVARD